MKINRSSSKSFTHRIFIWISVLIFVQSHALRAQLIIVPIDQTRYAEEVTDEPNLRAQASLNLPFFDDFSTSKTPAPNTRNWLTGSGVYINNTLTSSHPSVNVATFDGLNANGIPYNVVNPLTQGYTDTLTSQPVNLGGKVAADSVYLSFYWAAKGLGELPDSSDFLRLELYSKTNEWVPVWTQLGYEVDTLFHQQFISIKDPNYLHDGFQFRFRSYGRSSGPYDSWHLDYVYLNAKRSVKQPYLFDVAMRKPVSNILRKYTAMPLRQYRANPQSFTADSVRTDIVNHFNNFNILTSTFTLTDVQRGTEYARNVQRSIYVASLKSQTLGVKLSPLNPAGPLDSLHLISKFYITTTDTIPGANLKTNDTITARTALADYFAYDDGSAEYGVQMNQKLGRVAVQYVLAKADTIGGVRMSMVSFNKDISGQGFTIQILGNKNGKPDQVISQRSVAVRYPAIRDGLIDYAFSIPVAVPDTFYVGWLQINDQPVTVGFDRNSTLGANSVYYNLGTEWAKETSLKGSIMIRPYLGKKAQGVITGNEPNDRINAIFYPNPAKGEVQWNNRSLNRVEIYSSAGNLIHTFTPSREQQSVLVDHLSQGIYIFKATDGKRSFVQKMLISK
ncbi:T9SS type A sorting domain-containing protein [Dyadobacter sp. CY261]|uniref:T9SS type A sorting domain-containing protein n=1 Tax=Dyadobacter sp. CY261 TaxID=2907203 RepID=UPI001F391AD1|nr:T9SS type A sorting domain-containing protein [Dyadobacter sp. CY261]MCF0074817.1 T9SS type A sorting domain-containing protein [Dyadobacter sp. CY261]